MKENMLLPWGALTAPYFVAFFIFFLGAVAVLCQLVLGWRYKRGQRTVQAALRELRRNKDPIGSVEVVKRMFAGNSVGVSEYTERYLAQAMLSNSDFHVHDNLLRFQEMEATLLSTNWVRFVSSSALVMGLGGTFLAFIQLITKSGILDALQRLQQPDRNKEDSFAALSSSFLNVYSGFGHAFVASLAGLIVTVVLSFFSSIMVDRWFNRYFLALEQLGEEVRSRVASTITKDTTVLAQALQQTAFILSSASSSLEGLAQTCNRLDIVSERMERTQGASSELHVILNRLGDEMKESREGWKILLEALRDGRVAMSDTVGEFQKSAGEQRDISQRMLTESIAGMRDVVTMLGDKVDKVSAIKLEHLNGVQNDLKDLWQDSRIAWDSTGKAVLSSSSEAFLQLAKQIMSQLEASREDAVRAGQFAAQAVREEGAKTLREVKEVVEQTANVQHQAVNCLAEAAKLRGEAAEVVKSHTLTLNDYVAKLAQSTEQWGGVPMQVNEVFRKVYASLEEIRNHLAPLAAMPQDVDIASQAITIMAQQRSRLEEYVQLLDQSLGQWNNVPKSVASAFTGFDERLSKLDDSITALISAGSKWQQASQATLDRVDSRRGEYGRWINSTSHDLSAKIKALWRNVKAKF